jgi:hypothetical protein
LAGFLGEEQDGGTPYAEGFWSGIQELQPFNRSAGSPPFAGPIPFRASDELIWQSFS